MKAVIYARVSTTRQEISIESQVEKCSLQARLLDDCEVVEIIQDFGFSGKDIGNREGFQRILELLRAKLIDTVIVWKLDRLGRNLHQIAGFVAELDKLDAGLLAINENINSKILSNRLTLNILLSLAEFERFTVACRTKFVISHLRTSGKRYSGVVPFGWRDQDGVLVEDDKEKSVIKMILSFRQTGLSFEKIASELNATGVPTRRGAKRWIWTAVRAVVHAEEAKHRSK